MPRTRKVNKVVCPLLRGEIGTRLWLKTCRDDKAVDVIFSILLQLHMVYGSERMRRFPDYFKFGAGTAAYQIEGGWKADGKGENIWDHMTHKSLDAIEDWSNGDVTCNSYHNYKRDVEMLKQLGLDAYRFSISWSRVLPSGLSNRINEAGVQFYNNYIDEMLKYNITPMVTLYHWDLPQPLQDLGGFANSLFVGWFTDYARVAFEKFGDRVKHWITFNEPSEICHDGYSSGVKPPRIKLGAIAAHLCRKHLLMGHAKVYHLYRKYFKPSQGGVCGICYGLKWLVPYSEMEHDVNATEHVNQKENLFYTDPIFSKDGGWMQNMPLMVGDEGYKMPLTLTLTQEEKILVRGTHDFFGLNFYESNVYFVGKGNYMRADNSSAEFLHGLSNLLKYLNKKYNGTVFYITESGWATPPGVMHDDERVQGIRRALQNVLEALGAGVDIRGYFVWSLMDNFEWILGYTKCYGLYAVNFNDPTRTRTPRKSAFVYKHIVSMRVIDPHYEPFMPASPHSSAKLANVLSNTTMIVRDVATNFPVEWFQPFDRWRYRQT